MRRTLVGLLVALAVVLVAPSAVALGAGNVNFKGTWGGPPGGWVITSQQSSGACEGTSDFGGEYILTHCKVSGNHYEFNIEVLSIGYVSENSGTIEGNKVTGEFTDNFGHSYVEYTAYRTGGMATIAGKILDRNGKPATGVKVAVVGTTEEKVAVSQSASTGATGAYSVEVPGGEYTVTASGDPTEPIKQYGGTLAVATESSKPVCPGTAKEATCTLTKIAGGEEATVSFTYTQCGAVERLTNGKEPTGCPIIFVPGILGSRIFCGAKELFLPWKTSKFAEMQLLPDGKTNAGAPGSCNASAGTQEGEAGVLSSVAGIDAYGGMMKFLKGIATNGFYAFPYDWRMSVTSASEKLGQLVTKVLEETHAEHVVLVAHSMGGLVTQKYISEAANAKKVSRAVTIGTPYWGAPKSIISLLNGHGGEFGYEIVDVGLGGLSEVQLAARNYSGLFWLYPSPAYGPWLKIDGAKPASPLMTGTELNPWIESLGGSRSAYDTAYSEHGGIDHFTTNGVDYQIVVGTGVPTISQLEIGDNPLETEQWVKATYTTGDGTVPARSQTEGAYPGDPVGIPLRYVCAIKHAEEPGSPIVQSKIEQFVLDGDELAKPEEDCGLSGTEIVVTKIKIVGHGKKSSSAIPAGAMTVQQAQVKGLIQSFVFGDKTVIITSQHEPVTLALPEGEVTVRTRSFSGDKQGAPAYYGPLKGTVTISPVGSVAVGSKRAKAHGPARAPHTKATITRRGNRYLVRLKATDSAGVSATYTKVGKAARALYRRPLLLTKARLKTLLFASVDVFGDWEKPQRAHVPR